MIAIIILNLNFVVLCSLLSDHLNFIINQLKSIIEFISVHYMFIISSVCINIF